MKRTHVMRLLASGAAAAALMVGSPAAAHADATGCTLATGPGSENTACISIQGERQFVRHVRGSLAVADQAPVSVCQVTVTLRGRMVGGGEYKQTSAARCGQNIAYADFYPNREFVQYSQMCVDVSHEGKPPATVCKQILP